MRCDATSVASSSPEMQDPPSVPFQVALHSCILASRLHEPYMLDLYDLEDWDPSLESRGRRLRAAV